MPTETMKTTKTRSKLFSLTCSALFLTLGVLLPQIFHLALGQQAGTMFLPMYLSVLLAGCFLGWRYGLAMGLITPVFSFFITQMPPVPLLFAIMAELAVLGLFSGTFNLRLRSRESGSMLRIGLAVLLSLLCSRAVYFGLLMLLSEGFGLQGFVRGAGGASAVLAMLLMSWPGILMDVILVPLLVRAIHHVKKGMNL